MPLEKKNVSGFNYNAALADIGIRDRDRLLAQLEAAARQSPDLEEVQIVHDLSWVMTQLDESQRRHLQQVRDNIVNTLQAEYGPFIMEFLDQFGITAESFVLPLAQKGKDPLAVLLFSGAERRPVSALFAGIFARWWVSRAGIEKINFKNIPAGFVGERFFGRRANCQTCNGQGVNSNVIKRALQNLGAFGQDPDVMGRILTGKPVTGEDLIKAFGDGVLCPDCSLWVVVPARARTNWICPVVDGNGRRESWTRIRLTRRAPSHE